MCFSKRNEFRNNNSNKVRGHPTYIYKKVGNKYYFIGITHAKITHRVRNIKLEKIQTLKTLDHRTQGLFLPKRKLIVLEKRKKAGN